MKMVPVLGASGPSRLLFLPIALVITPFLILLGHNLETAALVITCVLAILAAFLPAIRNTVTIIVCGLLLSLVSALAWHLLHDQFQYHFVWLYSAPALPWYLKIANCWGGDEGTLLFMGLMLSIAATRLLPYRGWAAPGALLLTAAFVAGAVIWNPFAQTPPEDLQRLTSQGMNAHLVKIWMAIHPPLIFGAFTLILAPSGAAFEALAHGRGEWISIARRYSRLAWLLLSAGLAAGMWWAYQDFTYGQFWHWDPVQTSVFVIWALVTAYMHGLRAYHPHGAFGRSLPFLALLAGATVLLSMAVTRNKVLASSHRYIGDSSLDLLMAIATVLLVASLIGWVLSLRRPFIAKSMRGEAKILIGVTVAGFTLIALVAAGQVLHAYINAYLGIEPARKPFMGLLTRWAPAEELPHIVAAYAQSTVDTFAVNRWLAPLAALAGILGGHRFLSFKKAWLRWAITLTACILIAGVAFTVRPIETLYTGAGMTSDHTRNMFPTLDLVIGAAIYLAIVALLSPLPALIKNSSRRAMTGYFLPVGFAHFGIMLAFVGALSATIFDRVTQKTINYPQDIGTPITFPDGHQVEITGIREAIAPDGAINDGRPNFHAEQNVHLSLQQNGKFSPLGTGNTLYRDERPPVAAGRGSVREICRMMDYRYARYASDPALMLDPYIHRGLLQDVQVWLPAINYSPALEDTGHENPEQYREPTHTAIVLKVFPLMSLLWSGLLITLTAAATLTFFAWRQRRPKR